MSSAFKPVVNNLTNNTINTTHATTTPFVMVSTKPASFSVSGTQDDVQNDCSILRYLLRQNCVTLHSLEAQPITREKEQANDQQTKPFIYTSTLSRERTLRMIMYRPQVLMAHTSINFVGFVSQRKNAIPEELEQELERLDAVLVEELTQMPGLLSYASLRINSGTWYNLVLMNDDQVRSHLKQGAHHQYAAYQIAPHYYTWIRIHSGTLPSGIHGDRFNVQRTKYYTTTYNAHTTEPNFHVYEKTYVTDELLTR
jgi:hypothetical protein